MRVAFAVLVCVLQFTRVFATLGVDLSQAACNSGSYDFGCLVSSGYTFAIIEAWDGGYGYTSNIAQCVDDAWNAGMAHVDVYAFMCPNCGSSASDQVNTLVNNLRGAGVTFGQLWFDIEQCDGCWNDAGSACEFVKEAVGQASTMGVSVGIYSSEYEWQQTVGGCSAFSNLPLWYAHYDNDPSFDDSWAYEFGGWSSPAIKQYNDQGPSNCNTNVDVDYYPS